MFHVSTYTDEFSLFGMNDTNRLIRYLYGEENDPSLARRVAEDETLRREYEELRAVKDALDQRSSPSPARGVVDGIVERAGKAAQSSGRSGDDRAERAPSRGPRRPSRTWTRRARSLTATVALVLLMGLVWWGLSDTTALTDSLTTESQPASAAESTPEQAGGDAIPAWDDREDVVRLHRRIEHLQTRSRADAWEADVQSVDQTRP